MKKVFESTLSIEREAESKAESVYVCKVSTPCHSSCNSSGKAKTERSKLNAKITMIMS